MANRAPPSKAWPSMRGDHPPPLSPPRPLLGSQLRLLDQPGALLLGAQRVHPLDHSSSTGYGDRSHIHTRLYTVYQDTNNRNMISSAYRKMVAKAVIQNLLPTSGGCLPRRRPRDREQLYIRSIDTGRFAS